MSKSEDEREVFSASAGFCSRRSDRRRYPERKLVGASFKMNKRQEMVDVITKKYGLNSPRVASVMLMIPREKFVDMKYRNISYADQPVPIGFGQTISQPYTVATMTDLLLQGSEPCKKVLEIGTGSGYQTAVLAKLVDEVYSLEIIPELAEKATETIKNLGIKNVEIKQGSGEWSWPEATLFDGIIITAGIEIVPQVLFDQLKIDGVLVAPVGVGRDKVMTRYRKESKTKFRKEKFGIFHFVPFVEERN